MIRHGWRAGWSPAVLVVVAAAVLAGSTGALAARPAAGTTGPFQWYDTPGDPSVLCAYPDTTPTTIDRFRVRGPRVDFSYAIGEVGMVRWKVTVQRSTAAGWSAIGSRTTDLAVTTGVTETFPTIDIDVVGAGAAKRVRLVARLSWYPQPGPPHTSPVGSVKHVMDRYAWTLFSDGDPIRYDDVERTSTGSCLRRWTP